jgi:hypothetical protein
VCILWSKSEGAVVALGRGEELKMNGLDVVCRTRRKRKSRGFLQILPCPHLTLNHTWAELAVNINAVEIGDRVWTGMTH